jgi:hypothetical protein
MRLQAVVQLLLLAGLVQGQPKLRPSLECHYQQSEFNTAAALGAQLSRQQLFSTTRALTAQAALGWSNRAICKQSSKQQHVAGSRPAGKQAAPCAHRDDACVCGHKDVVSEMT